MIITICINKLHFHSVNEGCAACKEPTRSCAGCGQFMWHGLGAPPPKSRTNFKGKILYFHDVCYPKWLNAYKEGYKFGLEKGVALGIPPNWADYPEFIKMYRTPMKNKNGGDVSKEIGHEGFWVPVYDWRLPESGLSAGYFDMVECFKR